jgi:signal transduction histidine kinase
VKLHTKTGIYYALMATVLFAVAGMLFYQFMRNEVMDELDEQLQARRVALHGQLRVLSALPGGDVERSVVPVADSVVAAESLKDTVVYYLPDAEDVPYRQLSYVAREAGRSYRVTLRRCLMESEDLLEGVLVSTVTALALLLVGILALNTLVSRRLWRPFYRTLEAAEQYRVDAAKRLEGPTSGIDEFTRLNDVLARMTERIGEDYESLKQFTSNAAHELQTPLAVILAKLEGLVNADGLDEGQQKLVGDAYRAANKLNQLNRGLLLLTRIEAGRFGERTEVCLSDEVAGQLEHYREAIEMKGIRVTAELAPPLRVPMNQSLATVLVSTLLGNAVVHTVEHGELVVKVAPQRLVISNSGKPLAVDPATLFERFRKADQSSSSLGLGLSIAHRICETHGFAVTYHCVGTRHTVSVDFARGAPGAA